jgi:hemerythrin
MHRFDLTTELTTGNPIIDTQHRALFAVANEILFSSELTRSPALFRRAVADLVAQLEYGFASEELAMYQRQYIRRLFHTAFHDHVRSEVQGIVARLDRTGQLGEARQAIFFMLEDWITYHVAPADRELAEHLGEQAPSGTLPVPPDVGPWGIAGKLGEDLDERLLAASSSTVARVPVGQRVAEGTVG